MIQITSITRGYASHEARDADIAALTAAGYDHFVTYRDTAASIALCYGRTPRATIRYEWTLRHDDATTRRRVRLSIATLRKQRDARPIFNAGLDGASRPILRYRDELHLPDHRRTAVSARDRRRSALTPAAKASR